jgi:hypothetical protein
MKVSLKTNVLGQVLAVSSLAVGIAAGISAAPAQAVVFTDGQLAFSDGALDFFGDVTPGAGDTFSTTFNGNGTPTAIVNSTVGTTFAPFFGGGGSHILNSASTANFQYVSSNGSNFTYQLTNDLLFSFSNGVNLTIGMGSQFLGGFNNITNGVDFGLSSGVGSFFENNGDITNVNNLAFSFNDIPGTGGGTYGLVAAPGTPAAVPEPFTIIGSIIGGTSAFRMKKKLAAAAKK